MCIRDSEQPGRSRPLPSCQETADNRHCRREAPVGVADPTSLPVPECARHSPHGLLPLWSHPRAAGSGDCRGVAPRHTGQRA
eukprot:8015410-Alexandrium_andersonii.AAC.1